MASFGNRPISGLTSSSIAGGVLLLAGNSNISDERVFTLGAGLTGVDDGANAAYTITNNLLTGKAGGQTAIGGTGASEALILSSTSNATKGTVQLGGVSGLVFDEVNSRVGIGAAPGAFNLDVTGTARISSSLALPVTSASLVFGTAGAVTNLNVSPLRIFRPGETHILIRNTTQNVEVSLGAASSAGLFGTYTSHDMVVVTGGLERLRIGNASGNTTFSGSLITSGLLASSNTANLQITAPSATNALGLFITSTAARTATSGVQRGIVVDFSSSSVGAFAPTSGTASFRAFEIGYGINQTGGANGTVTGVLVNATETAVLGTHNLFDFQVGGVSKCKVNNAGTVTAENLITNGSGTVVTATISANNGFGTTLNMYSNNANAAASVGYRLRSNNSMTAGNDRFLAQWYRDSGTNMVVEMTTAGSLALGGAGSYTDVAGACLFLKNVTTAHTTAPTAGTVVYSTPTSGLRVKTADFVQSGGSTTFKGLELNYTVNQTSGANGTIGGFVVNATETALGGPHNLLDLQRNGTNVFRVNSLGYVTCAAGVNLTVSNVYATSTQALFLCGALSNAAAARPVRFANIAGLTPGNDRFLTTWYNDNVFTTVAAEVTSAGSLALGGAGSFTNMVGAGLFLKDVTTAPTTNPTGGIVLFSDGGVLKCMFPSGAIKTVTVT